MDSPNLLMPVQQISFRDKNSVTTASYSLFIPGELGADSVIIRATP